MWYQRITWQFFLTCLALLVLALLSSVWYATHLYNKLYVQTAIADVSARTTLFEREIGAIGIGENSYHKVDSLCKFVGPQINTRITVILPSGKVIGDSHSSVDSMENHSTRPEFLSAMSGIRGVEERKSATLHEHMLYCALPLLANGSIAAVVRLAVPLEAIHQQESRFYYHVAFMAIIILSLFAIVSYSMSNRLSTPIQYLKTAARQFASGNLSYKLISPPGQDMSELAEAMNRMASALSERIQTITRNRNELNAILTGMSEGVIAIDTDERIIWMNPGASRFLGISDESAKGKWLHEMTRNSEFQKFISNTLVSPIMVEASIVFPAVEGDRIVQAHGSVLRDNADKPAGAVIVINDMTRIKRLENIRKEFVANVSHELRTPLTSIKGFVETIRDGNYNLPTDVSHFLSIIDSKTDRLCSIIDDILALSSIERDSEQHEIGLTVASVNHVIEEAVRSCMAKAQAKNIELKITGAPGLEARINPQLIEQAIVNLLDNAVKYSNEGKTVNVSATEKGDELEITVADEGIGIPEEHLHRIFERFYRVDKARSRKLGGTGLGLAIVKNIVIAHGGRVSVESVVGKGSTFKMNIPSKATEQG